MTKFEYKITTIIGTDDLPNHWRQVHLNEQGEKGWELVSIVFNPPPSPSKTSATCVFKRVKEDKS